MLWHGTRPALGPTPGAAASVMEWTVYTGRAPVTAAADLVTYEPRANRFVGADELAATDLSPSVADFLWRMRTRPDHAGRA